MIQDSVAANVTQVKLEGLYEPPPVAFTFETIGWSVLAVLLVLILILIVFFQIRKYIRNKYRREALIELESINGNTTAFNQTFVILKRVAIRVFGREKVGPLYGKEWLGFLEKTGRRVSLVNFEEQIYSSMYNEKELAVKEKEEIILNAKKWIKTHANKL